MTTVSILMWVFTAICWWKIFDKANIKGWKAIIPYYSDYVRFKMVGKQRLYIPFLLITIAETAVSFVYTSLKMLDSLDAMHDDLNLGLDLSVLFWTRTALTVGVLIISIVVGRCIAARFGKSCFFGMGLGILPVIFAPVIAFDSSRYTKEK